MTTPWQTLVELLQRRRINAGLHLAWQFNPIHDLKRHREVDVQGSGNFFRAAAAAGLKRVVYAGSTSAYVNSGNPAAPPWLSEDTPPTGTPRYLYSKHKGEVDRIAQEFMQGHPEIQVIILRGAIVLGSHTQNIVSKMMDWPWKSFPWMFQVRCADPPMQFVSEEDIAEILYRAVKSEMRGIFNCGGDGVLRFSEIVRAAGKKPLAIPAPLLYPFTALLWALRLSPFPSGILDMIRYPWVADNTRLKTVFGYTPRHTSRQALDSFLKARTSIPS
jgi:UDP-glucose 4-epimerase